MSLRSRVEQIARDTAIQAATQLMYTRYQQLQNNNSSVVQITETDGQNLTVQLPNGTTQQATASGNRNVGDGSTGILVNGILL